MEGKKNKGEALLYSVTFITCPCCRVHSHQKQRKKKSRPSLLLMCRRRLQPVSRSQTLNFFPPAPTRQLGGHWLKISKGKGQRGKGQRKSKHTSPSCEQKFAKSRQLQRGQCRKWERYHQWSASVCKASSQLLSPFPPLPLAGKIDSELG